MVVVEVVEVVVFLRPGVPKQWIEQVGNRGDGGGYVRQIWSAREHKNSMIKRATAS